MFVGFIPQHYLIGIPMKNNLKLFSATLGATALVTLLGACATNDTSSSGNASTSAATPKAGTMFCHKERLYTASGDLVCNWATSAADACRDNTPSSRVAQSAATGAPSDAKRCESGQWLVQVTMK